ncbi:MAG: FGGY-family carbohydrate kinase [Gammaproteobacteria bacterium]|nr:FGGY-family carbohydrate kinase [Gammaproteobacteria bacterium]
MPPHYLGIDVGTSGVRACLIDADAHVLDTIHTPLPAPLRDGARCEQDPQIWWQALVRVLDELAGRRDLHTVAAVAIDATSATLLACDAHGEPLELALMYNDRRAQSEAARIAAIAPVESGAHGAHSSLAKALWLSAHAPTRDARWWLHQADWLSGRLLGRFGNSDENNALKLGYDPVARRWPDWLANLPIDPTRLPTVVPPGTDLGPLHAQWAQRWQLPRTHVVAGTTDSTAAVIATGATGADRIGQAVTSLGSTLVLKVLAERPVFAPDYGVYSHRLGERWLVGGASNSGGAVLRQFFSDAELRVLETQLHPEMPTGLDYYPLPGIGERFPHSDPALPPRLEPRPADATQFLQGLLEGIARIEQQGYALLHRLGAPYPSEVISIGGGAVNAAWRQMRAQSLGVPVRLAEHQDAAYGAALLARQGTRASPESPLST